MSNNDFNADIILREFQDGDVVSYICNLVTENDFPTEEIPYFYELVSTSGNEEAALKDIEENLLDNLALFYDIFPDRNGEGNGCSRAPFFYGKTNAWIAALSSRPEDILSTQLTECTNLTPGDGESCVVVEGKMAFTVNTPSSKENEFLDLIMDRLNSGVLAQGTNYQTKYIGSFFEPVQEPNVPGNGTPDTGATEPPPSFAGIRGGDEPTDDRNLTAFGGIIMGAMIVGFAAIIAVIIRKRRRRQMDEEIESALKSVNEDDFFGSDEETLKRSQRRQVSVLSDFVGKGNQSVQSESIYTSDSHDGVGLNEYERSYANSYKFDLGKDWRDEVRADVMGIHSSRGPTSITVVPPYPMEETSQSDHDSWAQTDGTVGSLQDPDTGEI